MKISEYYEAIKARSLQQHKVSAGRKITAAKTSIITIISLVATLSLCACQNDQLALNNNTIVATDSAYETLCEYGIEIYDSNTNTYVSNSVDDYRKIKDLNESDLLGYYELLGMDESEKVVQALGYASWDDFLLKNNYVKASGEPDFGTWKRTEQEKIGKESEGYHK